MRENILLSRKSNVYIYVCLLVGIGLVIQTTVISSFRIPTDSMQPTLQPGDNILVNKTIMGARIFNIWDAAEEKEVEIYRLPGMGRVKHNDVLVFHYPYPHKNDSLSMHLLKYYVKRCIALPGDTMGIREGHYYIKGMDGPIGNVEAQERIARLDKEDARGIVMDAYPWDKYIDWTIQDFGPLHVPAAGQAVVMDSTAVKLYRNLVEWEQQKKLTFQGKKVFLGDSVIQEYRFRENYYFVGAAYLLEHHLGACRETCIPLFLILPIMNRLPYYASILPIGGCPNTSTAWRADG